jgi:hypothetical protein
MTEAKNLHRLVIVLVSFFLGAGASMLLQVFVLQEEEAIVYGSGGRFTVKSPVSQDALRQFGEDQLADFHGIVIETMESAEMHRRALGRIRLTHPDLASCEVQTAVSSFRNSGLFSVSATGQEPEFTRIFLDSLMDEFIAFREMAALPVPLIQERASPAAKVLGDWQEAAISGAATGGLAGLIAGLMLAWTLVRPERDASHLSSEDPGTNKSSFMGNHRMLIWGVALGMVSGLIIQIVRLTNRPQEFCSLAKVVGAQRLSSREISMSKVSHDYNRTTIEILESPQLQSLAMKRVKALNPEVKERDVDVRVAQTKGSAIFNVLATSSEPKFTQIFLDALLDEFMILRNLQLEEAGLNPREDVFIQERATPASENVEDWSMPLYVGVVAGTALGGLLGLLGKFVSRAAPKLDLQT